MDDAVVDRPTRRTGRAGAAVVAALALVGGCGGVERWEDVPAAGVAEEAQVDGGGWWQLRRVAEEVEGFGSLAEMGAMADVVVIAQPTGVAGVRRVGLDGPEGLDLVGIRLTVLRSIGVWEDDEIVLEVDRTSELVEADVAGFPPALIGVRHEAGGARRVRARLRSGPGALEPLTVRSGRW